MYLSIQNPRLKTAVVALICLTGSAVSTYFLYRDLTHLGDFRGGEVLASLSRRDGDAQRKHASTFVWHPVNQGADLFRRDSVRGPSLVRFKDGAEMELGEDSLVVIENIKDLELNTLQGSVIIRSGRSGLEEKRVTVGKDGKRKVDPVPVRLLEPRLSQVWVAPRGRQASVPFQWSALGRTGLKLEVAQDRAFRVNRQAMALPESAGNAVRLDLTPSQYYWRLSDAENPVSDVRPFSVVQAPRFEPTWPLPGAQVVVASGSNVALRWNASGDLKRAIAAGLKLDLEWSEDSSFVTVNKQPLDPMVSQLAVTLPADKAIHWRLVSRYPDWEATSAVSSFNTQAKERLPLTLLNPLERTIRSWEPELRFGWDFEAPADAFRIRIFKADVSVVDEDIVGAHYVWQKPIHGHLRWQVAAFKEGKLIGLSPIEHFEVLEGKAIALETPASGLRFEYWKDIPEISFGWVPHDLFREGFYYLWESSLDPKFKTVAIAKRSENPEVVEMRTASGGSWYWRVRMFDASGRLVSQSKPGRVYLGPPAILPATADASPAPGETIQLETKGGVPLVAWEPVKDAVAYEVIVRDGQKEVFRTQTLVAQARLNALKKGTYFWTVKAVDPIGRRGEAMALRPFTVKYGAILKAPEIVRSKLQ